MIQSWSGPEAEAILRGATPRGVADALASRARRVLAQLNAATRPQDMAPPPGNRLKKLEGSAAWSVRVNDQFRITFEWGKHGPENVWFGDYH